MSGWDFVLLGIRDGARGGLGRRIGGRASLIAGRRCGEGGPGYAFTFFGNNNYELIGRLYFRGAICILHSIWCVLDLGCRSAMTIRGEYSE